MSKANRQKRVEVMETAKQGRGGKVWTILEYPDGRIDGPNPALVHPKDMILHVVGVGAIEGRRATDDELEAMYPGRALRLKEGWDAWDGRMVAHLEKEDVSL